MAVDRALVSVVMPVWNSERFVREAIESILAQTYNPLELIVVDDGSTDGSGQIARSFDQPVRYHRQARAGAAVARNSGIELARGKWLAFLDADDRWPVDKLARQVEALEQRPDVAMVFGHTQQLLDAEWEEAVRQFPRSRGRLAPAYALGAMLTRRETFRRVGPFASDYRVGEFVDWYCRATELGLGSLMLPDLVLWRRVHGDNLTVRERERYADYVRVLHASLVRRRAAGGDPARP